MELLFGGNPKILKGTVLFRTLHWSMVMTLLIVISLKQGEGPQAYSNVSSWSSCPCGYSEDGLEKMAMSLPLHIGHHTRPVSPSNAGICRNTSCQSMCVLDISLDILKPTLMFLWYGWRFFLIFSLRLFFHFERWWPCLVCGTLCLAWEREHHWYLMEEKTGW